AGMRHRASIGHRENGIELATAVDSAPRQGGPRKFHSHRSLSMASEQSRRPTRRKKRLRYAVVGLGHIAQAAVLPALAHAKRNSELAALVSDDPVKRREIGERYGVDRTY